MLENQLTAFSAIIHDEDIQKYSGDAFIDFIKAVTFSDPLSGAKSINDARKLLFHIPTVLFWDKMKRYLYGTFREFGDQVKLAAKFNRDNPKYEKFVKKQIQLINELDDDEKIDYFAQLTRSFLLTGLEESLFFKLVKFINICTPHELAFLRNIPYSYSSQNNAIVSSLYQYGLFDQNTDTGGGVKYVLSDFAKALKQNCLNFEDGTGGRDRLISYDQLAPLAIAEPATMEDISTLFAETPTVISGGSSK